MAESSLEDILSGEPEKVETEAEPEKVEAEPEKAEVEETGEEVEAEAEAEVVPPTTEKESRIDPDQFKGYLDERDKRQKLERELEELRKKTPPQKEVSADPIEDPEGFQAQIDRQLKAATFEIERKFMAKMHDDWEEAEAWINEQIGDNEAIKAKLAGSDSILEDAYTLYTQHKKLEEMESLNPEALKAQIRAEVLAELKAEGVTDAEDKAKKLAEKEQAIKPSLAAVGESGSNSEVEDDLEDIIGMDPNNRK